MSQDFCCHKTRDIKNYWINEERQNLPLYTSAICNRNLNFINKISLMGRTLSHFGKRAFALIFLGNLAYAPARKPLGSTWISACNLKESKVSSMTKLTLLSWCDCIPHYYKQHFYIYITMLLYLNKKKKTYLLKNVLYAIQIIYITPKCAKIKF